MTYDRNNVFAKIMRGEIPCTKVFENEYAFALHDIAPSAPTHILVLPKGEYISFADFMAGAMPEQVHGFFAAVATIAKEQGGSSDFRIITNNGANAGQSVFHFHVHILAGKPMGALLAD